MDLDSSTTKRFPLFHFFHLMSLLFSRALPGSFSGATLEVIVEVVFAEEITPPPAAVVTVPPPPPPITVVTVSPPIAGVAVPPPPPPPITVVTVSPPIAGVAVPPAIAVVSVPTKDGVICTVVGSIIIIVVVVSPKISQVNW